MTRRKLAGARPLRDHTSSHQRATRRDAPATGARSALVAWLAASLAVLGLAVEPVQAQPGAFADVPSGAYYTAAVVELATDGVFAGTECGDGLFCPDMPVTRWQMAVWTVRVLDGQEPPAIDEYRFIDVDRRHWYAAHVDRMYQLGVTAGCGDGTNFCPDRSVTRAEMAVFLTRAFDLPSGLDPGFADVPTDAWYADQVAAVASSGITSGCGDGTNFCPSLATTRAQIAAFLHRAINPSPSTAQLSAGACGAAADAPRMLTPYGEDPDWSPDCSQIVFSRRGSLWLMDNDGTRQRRLINHGVGLPVWPQWSPDGSRIAYTLWRLDGDELIEHIYVVNADGTGSTQLTQGDVRDSGPSWSPDGDRIAFSRSTDDYHSQIYTMASTGDDQVAVTGSDQFATSPEWSPDGTQFAYLVNVSRVNLIDVDGTNVRTVSTGFSSPTWSPDGTRLAFVATRGSRSQIVITDVDGAHEEIVTEPGLATGQPDWSPDGRLIAFHVVGEGIFVTDARGAQQVAADCKAKGRGTNAVTAGFPLPDWAVPAAGTVRVAVLFMDFPNAQAAHSTRREVEFSLPFMKRYLKDASNGQLDIEFETLHRWLRAEQHYEHYLEYGMLGTKAESLALALASEEIDFGLADAVMLVYPSDQFAIAVAPGNERALVAAGDSTLPVISMNVEPLPGGRQVTSNGWAAAHELIHTMGLTDLYGPNKQASVPRPEPGQALVAVDFGIMGLGAVFPVSETDPRLSRLHRLPAMYPVDYELRYAEMLGWSRWQLGWLGPDQVLCTQQDATVSLAPLGGNTSGVLLAMIPVSQTKVIVVESRRAVGEDRRAPFFNEGVMVYTVDAQVSPLPLKLAGLQGTLAIDDYPLLGAGESVSVWGHRIEVLADDGEIFSVRISKLASQ